MMFQHKSNLFYEDFKRKMAYSKFVHW